jgi:RNase P subunit RPR2
MQIEYQKGEGVAIAFNMNEIHVALQILNGLYGACGEDFIKRAIEDILKDIEQQKPKRLTMAVKNHLCEKCFRMLDEKDGNWLRIRRNGDVSYRHRECPPLKEDSERDK